MSCRTCGARCHGSYCADCKRERHMWAEDVTGGEADSTKDTQNLYKCTQCQHTYFAGSLGQCPKDDCDSHRARYIGDLEASA